MSSAKSTPRCWERAEPLLVHAPRCLLYGPPGTGKTHAAIGAGRARAQAVFVVTLTEDMSTAELRGHWIPQRGRFGWHDGLATAAWRCGGHLVLNELDSASGEVQRVLHAFLDDAETAQLTLETGETVRPAPGFTVVATMNGDPETLSAALRDRFPVALEIDGVAPGAIGQLPDDLQAVARETVALPPERAISIRAWLAFGRLRDVVGSKLAAEGVFGARAKDVLDALHLAAN